VLETLTVKDAYNVVRLIEQYGPDAKLTDWLSRITADCPKRRSLDMSDRCGAHCPDLSRVPSVAQLGPPTIRTRSAGW
jgi:hypothetical protein